MRIKDLLHQKDEKIVYFLRHHWIVYLYPAVVAFMMALLPLVGGIIIQQSRIQLSSMLSGVLTIALSIYYLLVWLFLFSAFLASYLDVWVVTTHRIVYIEQHSLFSRTIAEQPLFRVQDVTSDVKGVLSTFMGYGNIRVQTAGALEQFEFNAIRNPLDVSRTIFQLVEDVHKKETQSS